MSSWAKQVWQLAGQNVLARGVSIALAVALLVVGLKYVLGVSNIERHLMSDAVGELEGVHFFQVTLEADPLTEAEEAGVMNLLRRVPNDVIEQKTRDLWGGNKWREGVARALPVVDKEKLNWLMEAMIKTAEPNHATGTLSKHEAESLHNERAMAAMGDWGKLVVFGASWKAHNQNTFYVTTRHGAKGALWYTSVCTDMGGQELLQKQPPLIVEVNDTPAPAQRGDEDAPEPAHRGDIINRMKAFVLDGEPVYVHEEEDMIIELNKVVVSADMFSAAVGGQGSEGELLEKAEDKILNVGARCVYDITLSTFSSEERFEPSWWEYEVLRLWN